MYKHLNFFLKSKYFDSLPTFFSKIIFKRFKIFFVETTLKNLPEISHPSDLNYEEQKQIFNASSELFYKPFTSCSYLLEILKIFNEKNEEINFYDFGANKIDNYLYLTKNISKLTYYYYDQTHYNDKVKKLSLELQLKRIIVDENFKVEQYKIDFAYFGSVLQYLENYKDILKKFSKAKSKYIIISQTPFFNSQLIDKNIVVKQLNIHPQINYAYFFKYNDFLKYMVSLNYELINANINNVIKFLNFKNFDNRFTNINFLDLIFKIKNNDK